MGLENQERIEIVFRVSADVEDSDGDAVVEDFRAAVGALLALPRYADLVSLDDGCTEAYRALPYDDDRHLRVLGDLAQSHWQVRKLEGGS